MTDFDVREIAGWATAGSVKSRHINSQRPLKGGIIIFVQSSNPDVHTSENAKRYLALASILFPGEEWVLKEAHIWVAKSRLPEEYQEPDKWEKEMSQARILTGRGSAAYFLPESDKNAEPGKRYPDMVLDGEILEIKAVTGAIKTLGLEFKRGYKQGKSLLERLTTSDYPIPQGHSVFIHLFSDIKMEAVRAKIAGELKVDLGRFICFFEQSGKIYSWTYEELRAIIGKR